MKDRLIKELRYSVEALLEWIDAVPEEALSQAMPGIDRDYVESLLDDSTLEEWEVESRTLIEEIKVCLKDGSSTIIYVSEDQEISEKLVELCEELNITSEEILSYSIVGTEEV